MFNSRGPEIIVEKADTWWSLDEGDLLGQPAYESFGLCIVKCYGVSNTDQTVD